MAFPTQTPHRTPLRRVSQGSLFALSRSGAFPDAPHGLGFLEPAMSEFVDETETLQANVENMQKLSNSLATFNESFASWLYIMNMNALTVDWRQAPNDMSFILAKERAEEDARAALDALRTKAAAFQEAADKTTATEVTDGEMTFLTNAAATSAPSKLPKKKAAKPKLTAKERKERNIEIERIISCLPLEFRGSDPNLRRHMELVIEGLLNAPNNVVKLTDLIAPPDLSQARVNKCLIALVNRKIVKKENSTGNVLYHWHGV